MLQYYTVADFVARGKTGRMLFRPVISRFASRSSYRALCGTNIAVRCFPPPPSTVPTEHRVVSGNVFSLVRTRLYSSPAAKLSSTERIKVVLREYGAVAVVFHTVMSLASLGTCYLVVDR